ncbi:UDP-N-acetylmuramoyl-L-alanyl-D-glutamate--2,6-diaminopimelate ligase [Planococcus lenghuensis]|uniref:UDP-N-acetylmuramyl-tripeptide synthetase n=1 Tax=Planococcus lenghuensis TaxID=2213202 RepID=A0A1Q2L1X2_9BACL|nr:UDP-N-acetylmuramoyl-L-alanyl-D-glutamate--2,6-diaminopimelate ligase [Planococcus lenghuensis]AQQ53882.1 UDP-N-acetylmuramoyl-L-alanyl-D-glutamate--2,6-diaminopimelate ligase [Planococcus lenghuensis]
MKTNELLMGLPHRLLSGGLPASIEHITMDSRDVQPGSLFVCIEGYTVDGHDFAEAAEDKGAAVIIASKPVNVRKAAVVLTDNTVRAMGLIAAKFYGYPSKSMKMIGVTGTNGKTSVAGMVHAILMQLGEKSALSGTIGFNLDGTLHQSANTTSDSLTTQRMIRQAADHGCNHMTMEVSSHGLILGRLAGVEFDTAIFTNLTHDHLDFHGTMEAYGQAKGLLFAQLGQNLQEKKQVVLNADDPWSKRYAEMTPYPVYTYGIAVPAQFMARDIKMTPSGTSFRLEYPEGEQMVSMGLLGHFNVSNALAALAALYAEGYRMEELAAALALIPPVNGRLEKVEHEAPVSIFIDYAHTPDAIEKTLHSVSQFKEKRIIFLVGTGGNRDLTKRPVMAEKASVADFVVLTTDDPRFEAYDSILSGLAAGMVHENYACVGDREEAVRFAVQQAEPGDIIVLAGKGHEDYQIVGNEKQPHSDKEIAIEEAKKKFC